MNYRDLVASRKNYKLDISGLLNLAEIDDGRFNEGNYLEPWAKWHNSIPADIMLIGQDLGGLKYYMDNNGRDTPNNPTCKNLTQLFNEIGIDIGSPIQPSGTNLHFTNIIPFIRIGKMQGSLNFILKQEQINELAKEFTRPLIKIIKPKIIITLGLSACKAIMSTFDKQYFNTIALKTIVERPYRFGREPKIISNVSLWCINY